MFAAKYVIISAVYTCLPLELSQSSVWYDIQTGILCVITLLSASYLLIFTSYVPLEVAVIVLKILFGCGGYFFPPVVNEERITVHWRVVLFVFVEEQHHLCSQGGVEGLSVAGLAAVFVTDETCLFHSTTL